jgi:hypothetical protein
VCTFVHAAGLPERSQAKQRQHSGALRSLHPSALGRRVPYALLQLWRDQKEGV